MANGVRAETVVEIEVGTEVETEVETEVGAEIEEVEEAGGGEEKADILIEKTVGKLFVLQMCVDLNMCFGLAQVMKLTYLPFFYVDTSSRGHSRSISPQEATSRGRSPDRKMSRSPSHHSTSKSPDATTAAALTNAGPALLHVSNLTNNARYIIEWL